MGHTVTPAGDWRAAVAIISILAACSPKESRETTPVADSPATARGAVAPNAKVPLTSASEEAKTLYTRGRDFAEQLRNHDARELFLQAAAKDSTFAMAHYSLAQTSPTAKEFFQHVDQAVKFSNNASEGERLLILALQANASADPAKSLQYAEQLVAKYPQDERAHFNLGNVYTGRQAYDKAIAEFQKAIELNPNFSPAYNSLGYAYRPMGNDAEAERAFKKYIELVPNDPNPYDSYAELLMKMGRFDESIQQYQKALSIDPKFGSSHVGIAADYMYQGKHDQAIAEAQKLHDAASDDGDRRTAMFTQVVIDVDAGKTAQALQGMQKLYALGAKAGDTAAMAGDAVSMGDILLDAGRTDEASKRYEQALTLITNSSLAPAIKEDATLANHYDKARVALAKGDLATAKTEAAEYMKGAEAKQSDFRVRQAHELAGMIAARDKAFDEAIAHLGKGNQQDPRVIYTTAVAYRDKGDSVKARELFLKAANDNSLPSLNYAFVRTKAKNMK